MMTDVPTDVLGLPGFASTASFPPPSGWVANRRWNGGKNEGQKQVGTGPRADQDSGYCREAQ